MTDNQQSLTRAIQHHQAGEFSQAELLCWQIVQEDPRHGEAWTLLGILAYQANNMTAALNYVDRALAAAPDNISYLNNRAAVLQNLGRYGEAETVYREVLRLNPAHADAYNSLGTIYVEQGRQADAEASYRRALELRPDYPEAHYHLGGVLADRGWLDESEASLRRTIALRPDLAEAHNSLGRTLLEQGRIDEAEASFRRALELQPNRADFQANYAVWQLLTGDFEGGLPRYEWRTRVRGYEPPPYPWPLWDGSALAGRTILLHPDQGYGDTIQFVRYASLIQAKGGRVICHCHRPLLTLLKTCPGVEQVVPIDTAPPPFDVYAPLLSLPRLFGTTLATIPATVPYLAADETLVERWRGRMKAGFKVGIAWRGSPLHRRDRFRSAPLAAFARLSEVPGVELYSLQVGEKADCPGVIDLGSELDASSFADAAAVVRNLDLVVTIDTALAHLAGALAVPTWVLLPFAPDWRWLLEREDTPWYPTMRLFRQKRPGDWDEVFARVTSQLTVYVSRELV